VTAIDPVGMSFTCHWKTADWVITPAQFILAPALLVLALGLILEVIVPARLLPHCLPWQTAT
jgi:hypothetical protein